MPVGGVQALFLPVTCDTMGAQACAQALLSYARMNTDTLVRIAAWQGELQGDWRR